MSKAAIDLNCDLGEQDDPLGIVRDMDLLEIITSASIACGGHAGDDASMTRTVVAAMASGVAIGAHPGYPDRANFGRVPVKMALAELEDMVAAQVGAILRIADRCGGWLAHVKPHGALYHEAMRRRDMAEAVAMGVARAGASAVMIGQAGSPALDHWRAMGCSVAAEAFADRRYEPDGALRARHEPDALLDDPPSAAGQALCIAKGMPIRTAAGPLVHIRADTICLHSDTPRAVEIARAIRDALTHEGIRLQPLHPQSPIPASEPAKLKNAPDNFFT